MARILFSDHAVERFIERHAPEMSLEEARQHLENEGQRAVRLRERTILGQEQWELQNPKCILVIKNSDDAGRVCKTVLPNRQTYGQFTEDELEIIREASELYPPIRPIEASNHVPKQKPPPTPAKKPPPVKKIAACLPKKQPPEQAVEVHRLLMERARQKDEEKTRRHFNKMDEQISKQKRCIRLALRYLLRRSAEGDGLALEICEAIQEVEPGFLSEAFLTHKKTA
jgi:type IV secretory pathway VirB10-like protein